MREVTSGPEKIVPLKELRRAEELRKMQVLEIVRVKDRRQSADYKPLMRKMHHLAFESFIEAVRDDVMAREMMAVMVLVNTFRGPRQAFARAPRKGAGRLFCEPLVGAHERLEVFSL